MRRLRPALGLAILAGLLAGWGVLELTEPPGPGLDPDAVSYLGAAISVSKGDGLRIPTGDWFAPDTTTALAHFPPGFPAAIALGIAAGASPNNAARFVEAASAAVLMVALSLAAAAAAGPAGAIGTVVLAALTPAMVTVHGSVLSEPLFLALLALFVLVLARGTPDDDTSTRMRRLLLLSAIAAVASLVRYAGLALIGAIAVDAWRTHPGAPWRARARNAALTVVLPVVPFLLWSVTRPSRQEGVVVRRSGLYLRGLGSTLLDGWNTLTQWLAPGTEQPVARSLLAVLVLVAIGLVLRTVRRQGSDALRRLLDATGLVAGAYLGLVLLSRVVADPFIPLDDRLLAPLFVCGALAIGTATAAWVQRTHDGAKRILVVGLVCSWCWGAWEVDREAWRVYREDGGDFAAREWRLSPTVAYVAALPAGQVLYTNWPAAVWFHTGRAAGLMPPTADPMTVARFRAKVERERALVIAFRTEAPEVASPRMVLEFSGLMPIARLPDGVVWAPSGSR